MTAPSEKREENDHLEPCPFCGSTIVEIRGLNIGMMSERYVRCDSCEAHGPGMGNTKDQRGRVSPSVSDVEREAKRLWNERA
jgi:hypothetical protein